MIPRYPKPPLHHTFRCLPMSLSQNSRNLWALWLQWFAGTAPSTPQKVADRSLQVAEWKWRDHCQKEMANPWPEKIDGLHALNCWTPRLDGFLWIRFGLHLQLVIYSVVVMGSNVRSNTCFGGMPYRFIPTALQRLPVHRGITWTRLSADTKKPNTSLHPCKKNIISKDNRNWLAFIFPFESLLTRNLKWDENGRHGVNGWISGRTLGLHGAKIPGRMLYVFWRCMLAELYCTPANGKKLIRDAPPHQQKDNDAMEGFWVESCKYWSLQDNLE